MVTFTGFGDEAVTFYEGLIADNSKAYRTSHKHIYERAVQRPLRVLRPLIAWIRTVVGADP